ncbi:hypothetical protein ABE02_20925 [Bacillus licheniformis]|nr:hypothetical protein [Bacillus licheniformis]
MLGHLLRKLPAHGVRHFILKRNDKADAPGFRRNQLQDRVQLFRKMGAAQDGNHLIGLFNLFFQRSFRHAAILPNARCINGLPARKAFDLPFSRKYRRSFHICCFACPLISDR